MSCYRSGGCGPYEMMSCYECPASKPEYLERSVSNEELIKELRSHGEKKQPGKMGDECYVSKALLNMAADRIEAFSRARKH